MDEIHGAVLRVRLKHLDSENLRRGHLAARYLTALVNYPIKAQRIRPDATHVYHQFVCEIEDRDAFRAFLGQRGVGTLIHYPTPVHLQPAFHSRFSSTDLQVTETVAKRLVSLPIFPQLDDSGVDFVIEQIRDWFAGEHHD